MGLFDRFKRKKETVETTPLPAKEITTTKTTSPPKDDGARYINIDDISTDTGKDISYESKPGATTYTRSRSSGGGSSYTPVETPKPSPTTPAEPEGVMAEVKKIEESGESYQLQTRKRRSLTGEYTGTESIIEADKPRDVKKNILYRKEREDEPTIEPRFGSIGFGQGAMITLGEKQAERELQRFNVQSGYSEEIQSQFEKSGLTPEEFVETQEYKETTSKAQKQYEKIEDVPGLWGEPDTKRIPFVTDIKTLQEAGVGEKLQTKWTAEDITGEKLSGKYVKEAGKQSILPAVSLTADTLTLATLPGIGSLGVSTGRTALQKSLSKQLSLGQEGLSSAKITFVG